MERQKKQKTEFDFIDQGERGANNRNIKLDGINLTSPRRCENGFGSTFGKLGIVSSSEVILGTLHPSFTLLARPSMNGRLQPTSSNSPLPEIFLLILGRSHTQTFPNAILMAPSMINLKPPASGELLWIIKAKSFRPLPRPLRRIRP